MIFILLPAYNEEISFPPLMEKLELVLNKIDQEYKLIVCNDGSSDNTKEILETYAHRLPWKLSSIQSIGV